MPRKPCTETNPAITKALGAGIRERTTDIVSEELPDDIKKLLKRMRADVPKPRT